MGKKLFDFAIGNPPYQDMTLGDNKGFAPPVYNRFLDASYEVAGTVEMIHPARFLFNAGSTPKAWNEKMLNDEHLKVLNYEADASKVFPNTDIKGGVAVTYHSDSRTFNAIGIFTPYEELNSILRKVCAQCDPDATVERISVSGYSYHFTEQMHKEHPEFKQQTIVVDGEVKPLLSVGHEYDLKSNIIDKLQTIFHDSVPKDGEDYIVIVGREGNGRVSKYIKKSYINDVINLNKYKLFLPKASGIGAFGEPLGQMLLASPGMGHTETFFSIGKCDTEDEADHLQCYLKGKFARCMLSVLKKTQNITPGNFKYVPLQNFASSSDIDWSKPISEIDRQLYQKYGLDANEIEFIETHVKEMN